VELIAERGVASALLDFLLQDIKAKVSRLSEATVSLNRIVEYPTLGYACATNVILEYYTKNEHPVTQTKSICPW